MNKTTHTQGPVHQPGVFNIETFDGQRWRGGMNRIERDDAICVAAQWAADSGRRYRVFDAEGRVVFDTGASAVAVSAPKVDVLAVLDVLEIQTRQWGGSPSCQTIAEARAAVADLIERDRMQREALTGVREMALKAAAHWDADEDSKVGKILLALSGYIDGYDRRSDALTATLARVDGTP